MAYFKYFPLVAYDVRGVEDDEQYDLITNLLSRVLVKMSALNAATVIGLPLIEPELSISKVTIVSLNSDAISFL